MKKHIEQYIKFLVYGTFFVPLVLVTSFIFPFIVPKILLFRTLVMLLFGGYILLLIINWQEYRPRFSLLSLAMALFLGSFTLSTFLGVDPYHSFWDNHERMLGLFTIVHYFVYYAVCSSVFKNWNDWQKLLKIFLIAGSCAMFIGVMQKINPDFLLNQKSDRVISTLGNAIYVGGYALFLIFVASLLALKETSKAWRYIEIALGAMAVMVMFFSGTRGSFLGLCVALVWILSVYGIVLKNHPRIRKGIGATMAVGVVVFILLFVNRTSDFVRNLPTVGRALNTTVESITNSPRGIAWNIAYESWKEKPLFGWGPNNYAYAFDKYYNPRSLEFGYGETWFDNAHNIILNTLNVQGIFGLIIYIALFAVGIVMLVQAYRKKQIDSHLLVLGSGFLIAHIVQNITVFENPTSYLYFMVWLAMITSLTRTSDTETQTQKLDDKQVKVIFSDKKVSTGAFAGVGLVVFFIIFVTNIQPARANRKTLVALNVLNGNPSVAAPLVQETFSFSSPHIDDIRGDVGRIIISSISAQYDKLGKDKSMELLNLADEALEDNDLLHPLDIRNKISYSHVGRLKTLITNEAAPLLKSESILEGALKISPKRQQLFYELAEIKLFLGKKVEAINLLQQALNEDPEVPESHLRLAIAYHLLGQDTEARKVVAEARKKGIDFGEQGEAAVKEFTSTTPQTTTPKTVTH